MSTVEHAHKVAAWLREIANSLPAMATQIEADETNPRELMSLANRLHDVAGHLGLVADHRRDFLRASGRCQGDASGS